MFFTTGEWSLVLVVTAWIVTFLVSGLLIWTHTATIWCSLSVIAGLFLGLAAYRLGQNLLTPSARTAIWMSRAYFVTFLAVIVTAPFLLLVINKLTTTPARHIIMSSVSFANTIHVEVIPPIDNKVFVCTHASYLKKGAQFAASGSWSMDTASVEIGGQLFRFSDFAILPCSDGTVLSVFPAVLKAKIDIKAGDVIHADGYEIEAKRAVQAGDTIDVFRVGDTSAVSVQGEKDINDDPWFTVFKKTTKANDRNVAIEARQAEWRHVR